MTTFAASTIGVTGASGHLARRVIELLLEQGAEHIVGLTRHPEGLADLARRGVAVRGASFDDPQSLRQALSRIDRLLIVSTDALGNRTAQQAGAVDAALAAGVSHLAYASVTSPYPDPAALVPNSHYWTEVRIAASGVDFSLLRNNQYTDYLIPAAQHALASGTLAHAAGSGRRAFVTREDCARAAAAALLTSDGKHIYDIGGPEALSDDELAAIYTQLFGKSVVARAVPSADFRAGLLAGGVPGDMADVLTRFDTDTAKGLLAIVSGDVETLTGTKPTSVEDLIRANRVAIAA
jgi:NAD(P)H dehydrogenase (quinone)